MTVMTFYIDDGTSLVLDVGDRPESKKELDLIAQAREMFGCALFVGDRFGETFIVPVNRVTKASFATQENS